MARRIRSRSAARPPRRKNIISFSHLLCFTPSSPWTRSAAPEGGFICSCEGLSRLLTQGYEFLFKKKKRKEKKRGKFASLLYRPIGVEFYGLGKKSYFLPLDASIEQVAECNIHLIIQPRTQRLSCSLWYFLKPSNCMYLLLTITSDQCMTGMQHKDILIKYEEPFCIDLHLNNQK